MGCLYRAALMGLRPTPSS